MIPTRGRDQESLPAEIMVSSTGLLGVGLVTEKVITLLAMAAITFLFGMLPYKLLGQLRHNRDSGSRARWQTIVSFSSCFSGGVFIAACLLDLLPDIEEKIEEVLKQVKDEYDVDIDYPLAQFIMCLGFLLILLIEQAALTVQESWTPESRAEERSPLLTGDPASYHSTHSHQHHHHHHHEHQAGEAHHHHHHGHSHVDHSVFEHSALRSLMLVVALSFHSVFEGIAIGVQGNGHKLLSIFVAVMVHKALMAFSLGLNMAQSGLSKRSFVTSNLVFTLASPLGVAIGIGMSGLPPSLASDCWNGVLQGIAGGTFLYITFFEVLPHELNAPGKRLWKVLCVILGYAAICGLLFICH